MFTETQSYTEHRDRSGFLLKFHLLGELSKNLSSAPSLGSNMKWESGGTFVTTAYSGGDPLERAVCLGIPFVHAEVETIDYIEPLII